MIDAPLLELEAVVVGEPSGVRKYSGSVTNMINILIPSLLTCT
jgi:hypothetical protein